MSLATRDDIERVFRELGALIPVDAVHHGWNIANLDYNVDASARERWSVDAIGPSEVSVEYREFFGGSSFPLLMVLTGKHGTIEARTADDLKRLVWQWIETVWADRMGRAR